MCKPIRNGGKRCPVHQHQNIAAIKIASHASGLTRHQTERLFAELRREGRNSPKITAIQHEDSLKTIFDTAVETELETFVAAELVRSKLFDPELDGATAYAQRLILARSVQRGTNLNRRFSSVAERTGFTTIEIAAKFKEYREAVNTTRNAPVDPEFNQNTRRYAEESNLPYDRASVVALEKLKILEKKAPTRRVTHFAAASGSHLHSYGYDEGRLEIVFNSNVDKIYAYQNVPERVWLQFVESHSPGTIFARQIRGNEDYQYANEEEASADAYAVRCAACGQFRAVAHACPDREMRADMEASGFTAEEIIEATETLNNQVVTVEETEEPEEAETTDAEYAILASLTELNEQMLDTIRDEELNADPFDSSVRVEFKELNDDGTYVDDAEDDPVEEPEEVTVTVTQPKPVANTNFVLAAPSLKANNPWVTTEANEPFDNNVLNNTINPVNGPLPELYDYVVTNENQFAPEKYDRKKLSVVDGDAYERTIIFDSDSIRWSSHNLLKRISPEDLEKMKSTPKEIAYVIASTEPEGKFSILHSYDSREINGNSSYVMNHRARQQHKNYTYELNRFGKRAPNLVFTADENREVTQAENEKLQNLLYSNEAIFVPQNATETRKYTFDANSAEQPHIRIGKSTTFRQGFKQNKVVISPVDIRFPTFSGRDSVEYVDDQGYQVGLNHSTVVTGEVAFRKNSDGVVETVSSGRKLRCTCYDYRTNYYCQHINYAERHMGNVVQQMVYVARRTAADVSESGEPVRHRLLSSVLANRDDVTIVEGAKPADAYVSFGKELSSFRRVEQTYTFNKRLRVPESLVGMSETDPTPEQIALLAEHVQLGKVANFFAVPSSPSVLRAAIKRSNIEVPIVACFDSLSDRGYRSYAHDINVTGAVVLGKTSGDLEDVKIISHTLKCSCEEYQEKYDCKHVRHTLEQSFVIIGAGGRYEATTRRSSTFVSLHNASLVREQRILAAMATTGSDRETIVEELRLREVENRARMEALQRERDLERAIEQARFNEYRAREKELIDQLNKSVIESNDKYRADLMKRDEVHDETYASNPKKFFDAYTKALNAKDAGRNAVPYKTENVLDSGNGVNQRKFGVELEFMIPQGVDKAKALRNIANDLHDAKLTEHSYQRQYHSAKENGYVGWSFEQDETVDGEIVSPILDDSPESWRQLSEVIAIIKKNGGVTNTDCGSHVHVSSASYEMSTAKNAELIRQTQNDRDIINRLASNPATGFHRGRKWCKPNVIDARDDLTADVHEGHDVLGREHGWHSSSVNFSSASQNKFSKSNIEFREWDGTLNPGVIQQQIAISVALVDRAERNVIKTGGSKKPTESTDEVGTGKQNQKLAFSKHDRKVRHSEESFLETEAKHGAFFDSLFRKDEHREAAVALFAITKWQEDQPNQRY